MKGYPGTLYPGDSFVNQSGLGGGREPLARDDPDELVKRLGEPWRAGRLIVLGPGRRSGSTGSTDRTLYGANNELG